jgi:hypothetical protein
VELDAWTKHIFAPHIDTDVPGSARELPTIQIRFASFVATTWTRLEAHLYPFPVAKSPAVRIIPNPYHTLRKYYISIHNRIIFGNRNYFFAAMAPKKVTTALEAEIIATVRRIYNSPARDELTVNHTRQVVEKKLKLKDGFLKEGAWKAKSKEIIHATLVSSFWGWQTKGSTERC